MSGITGQGNPSDINGSNQQPEIDYEALASSFKAPVQVQAPIQAAPQSDGIDYEKLASEFKPEQAAAPEPGFIDKMLGSMNAGGLERGLVKGVQHTVEGLASIPTAIGDAVASKVETGQGDIGGSIIQGFKDPSKLRELSKSIETIAPSLGKKEIYSNTALNAAADAMYGSDSSDIGGVPHDTTANLKPSVAFAMAADIEAGNIVLKGVSKAAGMAKIAAQGFDGLIAERRAARVAEAGSEVATHVVPKMTQAQNKAQDLAQLSDELKKSGLIKNVDGFDIPIMPSQIDIHSPTQMAKAEYLADMPEMEDFVLKQKDMIDDGFKTLLEATTPYKRTEGAVDIPLHTIVSDTLKSEGSEFAATRLKAFKQGGDVPVDASSFHAAIDELGTELGFKIVNPTEVTAKQAPYYPGTMGKAIKNAVFEAPDIDVLIGRGYTREYANQLVRRVSKAKELLSSYTANGQTMVPFKVIAKEYNELKRDVKALWDSGINVDKGYRINMTRLKGELQGVYDNGVGKILGGVEQEEYMAGVAKYSSVKSITNDLAKVTEDQMGSAAMSKYLFQDATNAASRGRVQGVKDLLELSGKPEAFDNVVANYVHETIRKQTGRFGKETVTDWKKVTNTFDHLDPVVKETMFGKKINLGFGYNKTGAEAMNDMAAFYDAVQRGTPSLYSKDVASAIKIEGIKAMTSKMGFITKQVNKVGDIFIQADKEASVARYLSEQGIEDVLKVVPVSQRGLIRRFADKYVARANGWEKIKSGAGK